MDTTPDLDSEHTASPEPNNPTRRMAAVLVRAYYQAQDERIRWDARHREDPQHVYALLADSHRRTEETIREELVSFASALPEGRWALAQKGIGPVFVAGLMAYIDPERQQTPSRVWSYAGLTPEKTYRKKGQKLTHNPHFKRLCFLIGKSFVLSSNREGSFYGALYRQRKAYEAEKNLRGDYADQAAAALERTRYGDDTKAKAVYSSGRLPDAHIDFRARRWAVKMFLSHFHHQAHLVHFGAPPPLIYPIGHLHHVDFIPPPGPSIDDILAKMAREERRQHKEHST